jgi:hypothetical protein
MNKRELTQFVAKATKLSETQAGKTINAVLEGIKKALGKGESVSLVGFGSFGGTQASGPAWTPPKDRQAPQDPRGQGACLSPRQRAQGGCEGKIGQITEVGHRSHQRGGQVNANAAADDQRHAPHHSAVARIRWARWLKLVFDIDMEQCPQYGGTLKIIAAIEEPPVITKILTHLGLLARAPPRSPARQFDLFQMA